MSIQIRYFASIREALGPVETVDGFDGTVGDLRALLRSRSPAHAQVLAPDRALRCALNQTLCTERDVVSDGAEVAFFPPVTGG